MWLSVNPFYALIFLILISAVGILEYLIQALI